MEFMTKIVTINYIKWNGRRSFARQNFQSTLSNFNILSTPRSFDLTRSCVVGCLFKNWVLNDRQNSTISHSVVNQEGWTSKAEAVHGSCLMGKEETLITWLPDGALQIIILSSHAWEGKFLSKLQQCKMIEPPDGKVISISCPPAFSLYHLMNYFVQQMNP